MAIECQPKKIIKNLHLLRGEILIQATLINSEYKIIYSFVVDIDCISPSEHSM